MTFSFSNLSLSGVQAAAGANVLAPGKHVVKISDVEVKDTKNNNGKILVVRLRNDSGVITDNINIHNASPEATRIGMEQLKALLVHGGHPDPDNIGAHGVNSMKGLEVGVIVGTEMYQGEARSKVKGYMPADQVPAGGASGAAAATKLAIGGASNLPF